MYKVINGKGYNTDAAQVLETWTNNQKGNKYAEENLYRKKTGEYFLFTKSSGGQKIIPITMQDAMSWAEKRLPSKEVEVLFSGVVEPEIDSNNERVGVLIPRPLMEALRERKEKAGESITDQIIGALYKAGYVAKESPQRVSLEDRILAAKEKAAQRNAQRKQNNIKRETER